MRSGNQQERSVAIRTRVLHAMCDLFTPSVERFHDWSLTRECEDRSREASDKALPTKNKSQTDDKAETFLTEHEMGFV